jgi:hypothetical protein
LSRIKPIDITRVVILSIVKVIIIVLNVVKVGVVLSSVEEPRLWLKKEIVLRQQYQGRT